jgi:plastocyanin
MSAPGAAGLANVHHEVAKDRKKNARRVRHAIPIILCGFCGGLVPAIACSKAERPPQSSPSAAPAAAAPAASPAGTRVTGKVPLPGSGIPVIVLLNPKVAQEYPPQTDKPVMDQVALTFGPPLLFVRTNQPAEFRNSDDTLHNVHVTHEETKEPQFNVAIPTGERFTYTFHRDGFYHVGCDIHPAMSAEIFASSSPYVTQGEADGSFALDDVPPGEYALTVYAGEKRIERTISVAAGTSTDVSLLDQ